MSDFFLFDIGSRGTIHPRWHSVAERVQVVGFEPDEEECRRLNLIATFNPFLKEGHFPIALTSSDGDADFYITRSPACSGFYKPIKETFAEYTGDPDRADILETKSIYARSLNSFCAENLIQPSFLKIDAQGSEFAILSAYDNLKNVLGVELELLVLPLYEGIVSNFTFPQAILRAAGFLPWWFRPQYWTSVSGGYKRIAWFDALYINEKLLDHPDMGIVMNAYIEEIET